LPTWAPTPVDSRPGAPSHVLRAAGLPHDNGAPTSLTCADPKSPDTDQQPPGIRPRLPRTPLLSPPLEPESSAFRCVVRVRARLVGDPGVCALVGLLVVAGRAIPARAELLAAPRFVSGLGCWWWCGSSPGRACWQGSGSCPSRAVGGASVSVRVGFRGAPFPARAVPFLLVRARPE